MIFNKAGRVIRDHQFYLDGCQLEVADCYQYLGIKLRPSGSLSFAAEELSKKARKAWYSISNVIYKDKRMSVTRAFQLFDSLVSPVALYGCEFWFPHVLTNKSTSVWLGIFFLNVDKFYKRNKPCWKFFSS